MTPASLDIQASEIPWSPQQSLYVQQSNGTHAWTLDFMSSAENLLLYNYNFHKTKQESKYINYSENHHFFKFSTCNE